MRLPAKQYGGSSAPVYFYSPFHSYFWRSTFVRRADYRGAATPLNDGADAGFIR
jgi:hypothetical protein